MAKREPVLKWRKVKGEWRAGPFTLKHALLSSKADWWYLCVECPSVDLALPYVHTLCSCRLIAAKRACERLARKIIAATKKGRKHGK